MVALRESLVSCCILSSSLLSRNSVRRASTYSVNVKCGIRRTVSKAKRKDGHQIHPRNIFWEERMQSMQRPPLWIEHNSASKLPMKKSLNKSWTSTEKWIAATSVITMIIAVVAFKIVFGPKDEQRQKSEDAGISVGT